MLPTPFMTAHNQREAAVRQAAGIAGLVHVVDADEETAPCGRVLSALFSQASFESDGVKWLRNPTVGCKLSVVAESGSGFDTYQHVLAVKPSKQRQKKNTLRATRSMIDAIFKLRDKLVVQLGDVRGGDELEKLAFGGAPLPGGRTLKLPGGRTLKRPMWKLAAFFEAESPQAFVPSSVSGVSGVSGVSERRERRERRGRRGRGVSGVSRREPA